MNCGKRRVRNGAYSINGLLGILSASADRIAGGLKRLFFLCQAEAVGSWRDRPETAGSKYKRSMMRGKPDSTPKFNGQMPTMG